MNEIHVAGPLPADATIRDPGLMAGALVEFSELRPVPKVGAVDPLRPLRGIPIVYLDPTLPVGDEWDSLT